MDLGMIGQVLWRFRLLLAAGLVLAAVLALLSYYKVTVHGSVPKLVPRAAQVWQADATILLTQRGFPEGTVNGAAYVGRFIGLAPLYASLANGTAVATLIHRAGGPLPGTYSAIPAADNAYGAVNGLPAITLFGRADSARAALSVTTRAANGFLAYLRSNQAAANIPSGARVQAQLLNATGDLQLVVPRKKTLPIVVFAGVFFATIALAFILENARRRPRLEEGRRIDVRRKDLDLSA